MASGKKWLDFIQDGGLPSTKCDVHAGRVMVYIRPNSIPFPTTWHRFTARDGTRLRVQDLTEEFLEPALAMLEQYFTRDEPPCRFIEIHKHPQALEELKKLWRDTAKHNLSLVCVEDSEDQPAIVGVNILTVVKREDMDEEFQTDDKVWAQLFGAVDAVTRSVNVFEHYGVDEYLGAYGLVVAPKWRGMGVGLEILNARIPLCKALGLKVTATVFTAGASQAVAKKTGFITLSEITYEELAKRGFVFPGIEGDTKSSKMMALAIE